VLNEPAFVAKVFKRHEYFERDATSRIERLAVPRCKSGSTPIFRSLNQDTRREQATTSQTLLAQRLAHCGVIIPHLRSQTKEV
jgi:hypothetical protein